MYRQPAQVVAHCLPHWFVPSVPSDSTGTIYSGQPDLLNRHHVEGPPLLYNDILDLRAVSFLFL